MVSSVVGRYGAGMRCVSFGVLTSAGRVKVDHGAGDASSRLMCDLYLILCVY